MKNLELLSVSSKKENPSIGDVRVLNAKANSLNAVHESEIAKFLIKMREEYGVIAKISLEVEERVYDCVGPGWSHSSEWVTLGEGVYGLPK